MQKKTIMFQLIHRFTCSVSYESVEFFFEFFTYHMQYRLILFQHKYQLYKEFLLINTIVKSHFKSLLHFFIRPPFSPPYFSRRWNVGWGGGWSSEIVWIWQCSGGPFLCSWFFSSVYVNRQVFQTTCMRNCHVLYLGI